MSTSAVIVETSPGTSRIETPKHGNGQLMRGNPGNKGGGAPPPSILREGLRLSYEKRFAFLDRVIDGEALQTVEVPLVAILPHVVCASCGTVGMAPDKPDRLLSFQAKASASVRDRIAALEHQAKYGMGALAEVSVESVRERVQATLDVIREHAPAEVAAEVITALRSVWS